MNEDSCDLGVVVIGRNEGDRLRRCIASIEDIPFKTYVDSESTDDSVAFARGAGLSVVELASPPNHTAARARNAGFKRLLEDHPALSFVQMVDGDCEVRSGWIDQAIAALKAEPDLAIVFGRRRERFPDRSIYNAFCDDEWNVPIGEAEVAGGDILCRVAALTAVGGYREDMIAGEDPDMALRLRKLGWRIRRIDAEMTLHDAAILRFGQWWNRAERAGHSFAELAERHPDIRKPDWRHHERSILIWGLALPLLTIAAAGLAIAAGIIALPIALLLLALWPYKMWRIAAAKRRAGLDRRVAIASGVFLMIGKFPEMCGVLRFHFNRATGRRSTLIEYKDAQSA